MRSHMFMLVAVMISPALQADNLGIKLGLWEMTLHHAMEGQEMPSISQEDLALLPEAQRAQVQGMMQGNLGTSKHCITQGGLTSNNVFTGRYKKCTHTVISASPNKVVIGFECTNKGEGHGTITVNKIDSEHTQGAIHAITQESGHEMENNLSFDSKYLGPDCAGVE